MNLLTSFRVISLLSSPGLSDDFSLPPLFSKLADVSLELLAGLFFSLSAATQTPNRRCQSFFSLSLLLLLLLLHRSCLSFSSSTVCCLLKPHRRTRDHQPGPTVSAGPQMCTKTSGRQRSAWRFVVALVRFFPRKRERERGREWGGERGRSVGLQLLLPPPDSSLRIAPFFTHCLFFFRFLHPLFCFVSPSSSWFKLFPPSYPC